MTAFLVIAGIALVLGGGYLLFWWLAGRQRPDMLNGGHDPELSDNPNRTKAILGREGISTDGRTWTDL